MTNLPSCPEPALLHQFAIGQVPAEEVEELANHVLHCEHCVTHLQGLEVEDTLTCAIQTQVTSGDHLMPPAVDQLMQRLRGLPMIRKDAALEETGPLALAPEDELGTFPAPPLQPDELGWLGGYRVLKQLGMGGMGVVHLAEDPQLQRLVALKVMKRALAANPSARKRFLREAQATAAIHNDHIVTIHQVGEDGGMPFIAMEFLEGEPLDYWLERGRKPTIAQVLRMGRELARGLAAAHERGLIHRDIKPANIWLEAPTGRVKILDFGLARAAADVTNLTQSGIIVGTPAYMSPEQARGDPVDYRCDLFGLGCVLYRLCAGRLPFGGETTMTVLTALVLEEPTPLGRANPNLPVPLVQLIMQLLAKEPNDRPATARAVEQTLKTIERDLSAANPIPIAPPVASIAVPMPVERSPAPAARLRGSRRAQLMVAAAALLLVGGLVPGVIILLKAPDGKVTEIKVPSGYDVKVVQDTGQDKPPASNPKPPPAPARRADKEKPFVLVRGEGQRWEFPTANEVIAVLQAGDVIEIHGNGPFRLGKVQLTRDQGLTIRAGPGYRPRLVAELTTGGRWMEVPNGPVELDGCDFENSVAGTFLQGGGASLEIRNCRFFLVGTVLAYYTGPRLRVTDSLISIGAGSASPAFLLGAKTEAELTNNVIRFGVARPLFAASPPGGQTIQLRRNTLLSGYSLFTPEIVGNKEPTETVHFEAEGNIFWLQNAWRESKTQTLKNACRWRGRHNLYVGPETLNRVDANLKVVGKTLEDWKTYWSDAEEGSRQVEEVHFQWNEVALGRLDTQAERLQRVVADLRRQSGDPGADWARAGTWSAPATPTSGRCPKRKKRRTTTNSVPGPGQMGRLCCSGTARSFADFRGCKMRPMPPMPAIALKFALTARYPGPTSARR